jgi:hypothetical protein
MRRLLPALGATVALLAPGAAGGVATPISPSPGAIVDTSHPVFSWSLPPNEDSDAIYVADAPDTTIEGRLFDESIVDLDTFSGTETSWSPSSPLPAGTYWWNVRSHDRETFDSFYSAPVSFTIPARARVVSIRIKRYLSLDLLDITVRFTANTEEARVAVRLRRGARTVWSKAEIDEFISIGETNSSSFSWYSRGRIPQGTRLQLQVTVDADGAHASARTTVRAP